MVKVDNIEMLRRQGKGIVAHKKGKHKISPKCSREMIRDRKGDDVTVSWCREMRKSHEVIG